MSKELNQIYSELNIENYERQKSGLTPLSLREYIINNKGKEEVIQIPVEWLNTEKVAELKQLGYISLSILLEGLIYNHNVEVISTITQKEQFNKLNR